MSNYVSKCLLLILGWLLIEAARAVTYTAPINDVEWVVDVSVFECRITQSIPFYGTGVFSRRAGEAQRFFLHAKTQRLKTGKAALVAQSPIWKPKGRDKNMGLVPVVRGKHPVNLGTRLSQQMLTELHRGRELVLTRRPWYGADESVKVTLTPISFQSAYRQYLDCLASLLPVNYEQISRTQIYFPSGGDELKPSELRKLNNIVRYVNADSSVTGYVIDGHTDSVGTRADNLELSKLRAEMVAQYLVSRGVNREKITVRWHGERYPVVTNQQRKGRAQNRRVTIRLDKGSISLDKDTVRLSKNSGGLDKDKKPISPRLAQN